MNLVNIDIPVPKMLKSQPKMIKRPTSKVANKKYH